MLLSKFPLGFYFFYDPLGGNKMSILNGIRSQYAEYRFKKIKNL
jgi:hypothetical protein